MKSYYFHSIRNFSVERLIQVLDTGYILPREMMNNPPSDKNNIFNGNKWISLTQKTLMDDEMSRFYRSSYNELVPGSICLVLEPNVEGITFPNYVDPEFDYYEQTGRKVLFSDDDTRFSYYLDEVQTNKPIPTSKIIAIGYPLQYKLEKNEEKEKIEEEITSIKSALERNDLNIPLIDSSHYDFADDEEKIRTSEIKSR